MTSSRSKVDIDVEAVVIDSGEGVNNGDSVAAMFWEKDDAEGTSGVRRTSLSRFA